MIRRNTHQSGFSLVELLVTALIFGIGLLGLAALQVSTLRSNSGGRNRMAAASLAEGCLSAIQAEGSLSWSFAANVQGIGVKYKTIRIYTDPVGAANGVFGTFDVNGQPVVAGSPTQVFTVNWARLAPTAATPTANVTGMNMSEFVVTVNWLDQANAANGTPLAASALTLSRLIRY